MRKFNDWYDKTAYVKDGSSYSRAIARDAWDAAILAMNNYIIDNLNGAISNLDDLYLKITEEKGR